ncbi:MAG: GNAT family N-acetyltransferase [Oceanococcaceae bacterium]
MSQRGELFTQPAYLQALQSSACKETGWLPAGPTGLDWLKSHSWGEFVFDQAFAQAYERAGGAYYPKWVRAVPFSPVPGPRLGPNPASTAAKLLGQAGEAGASGAHVLFLPETELTSLDPQQWLQRLDLRYVWHNRSYADFEAFLSALSSKRRKSIRAERRKVGAHALQIRWCPAGELSEAQLHRAYALYASTYQMRGQQPYLQPDCLQAWAQALPEQMLFCLAEDVQGLMQAMAFFFRDSAHLYGRHWGAAGDWDALHFELCYYQGMDYCLREGLQLFDAGVQGQHRLLRGFEPEFSHSVHHFFHPELHRAVGAYLEREGSALRAEAQFLREQHLAYKDSSAA